jgi:hypothetical protein
MRPDDERRTIAELGFKQWFTDVLWYHYKWVIIGAAAAILALAVLISWQSQVIENDITVVLVSSEGLSYRAEGEIKAAIGAYSGDVNGDGKIVVALNALNPQAGAPPGVQSDSTALMASIANPDIVLYIMDSVNAELYIKGNTGVFNEELAKAYGGQACAIPLDGSYLFDSLGLEGYFVGLKNKAYNIKQSDGQYYALAFRVLEGILSREN